MEPGLSWSGLRKRGEGTRDGFGKEERWLLKKGGGEEGSRNGEASRGRLT